MDGAQSKDRGSLSYRIFRRDIGRKLTALLCALVLFALLDDKVQDSQTFQLKVVFIDEIVRSRYQRTAPEGGSTLFVVERGPEKLVHRLDSSGRVYGCEVEVSGPKTAVENLRALNLFFQPRQEGRVEVSLDRLDGIDTLEEGLSVELVQAPEFQMIQELPRSVDLSYRDIEVVGQPSGGYAFEKGRDTVSFNPASVVLVGPRDVVDDWESHRPLFVPVSVPHRPQPSYEAELYLNSHLKGLGVRFDSEVAFDLKVELFFEMSLEEPQLSVTPRVRKNIEFHYDPDQLLATDNEFFRDGLRLRLDEREEPTVELKILVPSGEMESVRTIDVTQAKKEVMVIVSAQSVSAKELTVPVLIARLPDFPKTWDVRFADDSVSRSVKVRWDGPGAEGDGEPISEDNEN